ncbi:LmbE family N-acetylglucosaminyl deacetylase [Chitinophaga polysaccharea]|uniref:LmbE family N-acetylglucosaminyl deacetylase n=1 Tax=Chitinophaga polysaccharea TaxID=1293035 RepID=A0A561PX02_9BACT|nr:PIG-L family deacetylase [Chitinophaga polysaccharea]TWF42654.1 LmbE family N-acetylglucosaminyl deacetylase [Chitinophaga polysaccharea]
MFIRRSTALVIILLAAIGLPAMAQPSPAWNAADIRLQLKKLDTLGSVLYIAAHPDDENTRLLGYLAKEKLYRTGYLSLTRGDGGQNLVGNEQSELLGLIRTQELLAARRIDGAEQFFTRAQDFGFSKNPQETFTIWDREKILGDVVYMIRKFQPDVIICRFPADSRAGHGHHTASAMLAAEAFTAAADPKRYPEQLKLVKPWQAKRILWNTFSFGSINTTADDQFKIDVGAFNPLLGKGFGEIAAESRSQHKSQGFGVPASRGSSLEYFLTIKGNTPKKDLLDDVNTSWSRVPGGEKVGRLVDAALAAYNMDDPSASVPALLEIRRAIQALPDGYWRNGKLAETEQLIYACAGLWAEAYSTAPTVVPGTNMEATVQLINRGNVKVILEQIDLPGKPNAAGQQELAYNKFTSISQTLTVPANTPESQPYWLATTHRVGMYVINDPLLVGNPENIPPLQAKIRFRIGDQEFNITRPLQYKYTDPVKGEIYQPLVIAPPVVADMNSQVYIFTDTKPQAVPVKIKAMADQVQGTVKLQLPAGFVATESSLPFNLAQKGDEVELRFNILPTKNITDNHADTFTVVMQTNGKEYTQSLLQIRYDHIPLITLFPPAAARLVSVNLKHNGNRLGYIPGAGDMVAASLRQVGYDVTELAEKDIMSGNLQQYDAIIAGVRAYNVNARMKYWQPRLMDYVNNGGKLIVQYNVNSPLVTNNLGPYPFSLSRDRVTDENAKVDFINPKDPVFHYPNEITAADFNGWVQERGLYYTANADKAYDKLFTMHDQGESPLDGSTLVAHYGKGAYVYTGLSFFRQLPAGVPGAYRLFVNLISVK